MAAAVTIELPPPFAHQARVLAESWDRPYYALFWQQRTGKTRTALETAAQLRTAGKIDAVLVLAPNGVHRQWAEEQVPAWLPAAQPYCYSTAKAPSKTHQTAMRAALCAEFPVLCMSYDGFMTRAGRAAARKFLLARRALFVCDESTEIKSPRAARTKAVLVEGHYAPFRRILTGTPVANSPFDVYSQVRFLATDFWKAQGYGTPAEFRARYAYMEEHVARQGHHYYSVARDAAGRPRYRNLDELHARLAPISSRVLRVDVLDTPPKLYAKEYFTLTEYQRCVYEDLRTKTMAWLDDGQVIEAPLAIVRLMRLAQVASNHLPGPDGEPTRPVDAKRNPRLEQLAAVLADATPPVLIWARWRADVDAICLLLKGNIARYDGAVTEADRAVAKAAFQAGRVPYLVGNVAVGAMGLDLSAARTVVYYSNSFSLLDREQSEDRAQGPAQRHAVEYVDLVAADTVDEDIINALRAKVDVASAVTGDTLRAWL
jgi:Mesyanzhinovviridae DNA helicase